MDTEKTPRMKQSDSLVAKLILVAAVSASIILAVAGAGIYRVYSGHVIHRAEQDAVNVASALQQMEDRTLVHRDQGGRSYIYLSPSAMEDLDARMRQTLAPFDIIKIKIYSADSTIVYSTDPSIIGRRDTSNARLARALAGSNDTKLERKEEVLDLKDERKIDVDVVETYVPIRKGDEVIGSFEVYIDVTRSRADLANVVGSSLLILLSVMLLVFAPSYVAIRKIARRLEEARSDLERLATTDHLTGLANRRELFSILRREHARILRALEKGEEGALLGLVILDLDDFKKLNDKLGHLAGDAVLAEVGRRLAATVRPYDTAGRYGGEEFLVILPDTSLEEAMAVAERIRQAIRGVPFPLPHGAVEVTASLGVAVAEGGELDFTTALKKADDALLAAKSSGKDRCNALIA